MEIEDAKNSTYINGSMGLSEEDWLKLIGEDIAPQTPAMADETYIDLLFTDDNSPFIGYWNRLEHEYTVATNSLIKNEIMNYVKFLQESPLGREFRNTHADLIERISWNVIDQDCANGILNRFISKVDQLPPQSFEAQIMVDTWQNVLRSFENNPIEFVNLIRNMLNREEYIFNLVDNGVKMEPLSPSVPVGETGGNPFQVQQNLSKCEACKNELVNEFSKLNRAYQELIHKTRGNLQILDPGQCNLSTLSQEQRCNFDWFLARQHAINLKEAIVERYMQLANDSFSLLQLILNEINQWQRIKAWEHNGKKSLKTCTLDTLAYWCNFFVKILRECYNIGHNLLSLQAVDLPETQQQKTHVINQTIYQYETMIKQLVQNTLVIENHPPQVLMKDKRFQCVLRHLIGDGLDFHRSPFSCEAVLVHDGEYERLKGETDITPVEKCGKIINPKAKSDFQEQSKQLLVSMRNMSLQLKQRGDRGGTDGSVVVAEKKFCMVFRASIYTRFSSQNGIEIISQALSLPIVVISHGKQEPDAQATIFWDNAFSDANRTNFSVPKSVPWSSMLTELDNKWKHECELGLTKEAKEFLTRKVYNHTNINSQDHMSYIQFNKDGLFNISTPNRTTVTFWTWLFKIMELVRHNYVRKYWTKGFIRGFISKETCFRLLSPDNIEVGTFLFRFSESTLGAISIVYKARRPDGTIDIQHYAPDDLKSMEKVSIEKSVMDLENLVYLHPFRPKAEIFEQSRAIRRDRDDGYIVKTFKVMGNNK